MIKRYKIDGVAGEYVTGTVSISKNSGDNHYFETSEGPMMFSADGKMFLTGEAILELSE